MNAHSEEKILKSLSTSDTEEQESEDKEEQKSEDAEEQKSEDTEEQKSEDTEEQESGVQDQSVGYEGIVLDPLGGPVAGAEVYFPELNIKSITSEEGTFKVVVPEGEYTVIVVAKGFGKLEEAISFDESAALSGFELMVEFPIEDVVITGTKTEKLVEKAPVKTEVIGRDKIERKRASNLAEALDSTPGVRVENNCQNCGFTQVRLNGLEGHYTQILIDGNPVFSSLAGVYGLEQIPEEMIERVEIVKGGGSALYGGNAIGGVINVITSRPRTNFANITVKGDAVGISEPEFRVGASAGVVNQDRDLALHVFGGANAREPWDANGDGFSEIGKVRQIMIGAESYIDVPDDGELKLKFHVIQEKRRGGDSLNKPEHDAAIAESTNTRRYGGEIRFSQLLSSHINYNLGYGFAYTERDSFYGGGGDVVLDDPPTAEQWAAKQVALNAYGRTKNPVHTADATVNLEYTALGEQIVTIGAQFLSDSLDDQFPGYGRKVNDTYWNMAGIIQHDWMYNDWAETVLGVRLDHHSELDDLVVSPRAAVMFIPLKWLRTRTAFSTGFRAPQVFDEDLHITMVGGEGQVVYNDPELKPERSYSLAQQLEFNFALKSAWEIKTSINGFWTNISDAFVVEENDNPETVGEIEMLRRNRATTTVYGAELEAAITYGKFWGFTGGWTLEKALNSEADEDFGSKRILKTPRAYGYAETFVNVMNGLSFNTLLDITGPMKVPHYAGYIDSNRLETSPWFADWSANVSYKFDLKNDRYVTPFIGIKNILDSRQKDYDLGADRDAGYIYGPRQPRSIFIGIKGGI
ncbi:MAG: TonB-dependent receptor [Deltaproteobacteria bacterium]|nr:TonB-dependent receptor [Deltaproteobacteria bacterium]